MTDQEKVVTKKAELEEEDEEEEQAGGNEVNKVVCKALFLSATETKTGKIGVAVLLHDGIMERGQVRVTLESKKAGKTSYILSPVIQTWFDNDPKKTDPELYKQAKNMLSFGGLRDVFPIVSGNGEFRRIYRFLSKEEYEMYLNLVK